MKIFRAAFCVLNIAMLFSSTLYPQRATERPKFRVEIRPTGERGPTCAVTNLGDEPVWAVVLEISSSSQPARKSKKVWDALLESHPPIEPGASISQYLSNLGRSPLPDKIEVVAAVWTDGETFGAPASVNLILNNRAVLAAEYEDAAAILQQGLNQNWTRDQYQQAFRDKPDNGAVYSVRTALTATLETAQTPQDFTRTMQFLLTNFQQLSKVPQIHKHPELSVVFKTRKPKSWAFHAETGFSCATLAIVGQSKRRSATRKSQLRVSLFTSSRIVSRFLRQGKSEAGTWQFGVVAYEGRRLTNLCHGC